MTITLAPFLAPLYTLAAWGYHLLTLAVCFSTTWFLARKKQPVRWWWNAMALFFPIIFVPIFFWFLDDKILKMLLEAQRIGFLVNGDLLIEPFAAPVALLYVIIMPAAVATNAFIVVRIKCVKNRAFCTVAALLLAALFMAAWVAHIIILLPYGLGMLFGTL
jgi:hypothetical protein